MNNISLNGNFIEKNSIKRDSRKSPDPAGVFRMSCCIVTRVMDKVSFEKHVCSKALVNLMYMLWEMNNDQNSFHIIDIYNIIVLSVLRFTPKIHYVRGNVAHTSTVNK